MTALAGADGGSAAGGAYGFSGAAGAHCDGSTAGLRAGAGRGGGGGVTTARRGDGDAGRQPNSSARTPVAVTSTATIHIRSMPTSLPESKRPIRSGISRGTGFVGLFRRFGCAVRKVSRIQINPIIAPILVGRLRTAMGCGKSGFLREVRSQSARRGGMPNCVKSCCDGNTSPSGEVERHAPPMVANPCDSVSQVGFRGEPIVQRGEAGEVIGFGIDRLHRLDVPGPQWAGFPGLAD